VELLLAIDTSGSMATRVTQGAAVLNNTAARLGDGDRLGLLTFGGGAKGVVVRVPSARVGPGRSGGAREAVRESLSQLRPAGATPLRRALSQGVSALLRRPAGASGGLAPIRALVVLTDGRDTVGGPDPARVADRAHAGGVRVLVVATGSADCSSSTLKTVVRRSGGRCLVAGVDTEPTADALAAAIWAGTDG
jgi:Mg-chelatase subunit ChlD